MGFRYYDHAIGAERLKRRYVWGFWAYLAGLSTFAVLFAVMQR